MPHPLVTILPALFLAGLATTASATPRNGGADGEDSADLTTALKGGRTWLNFRYRFEEVDDDGLPLNGTASTLRTVLGYETGVWNGWRATVEFEDVSPIGADNYNSTINGKTNRPVVADPDGSEVNQAFVTYEGFEDLVLRVGRREIKYDNFRFIRNVGWRQNHQSFRAAEATFTGLGPATLDYVYLFGVDRIFGDDSPKGNEQASSHLLHATVDLEDAGTLVLYDYYLDFDDVLEGVSTNTAGVRYTGAVDVADDVALDYALEFASQTDAGDNPNDVDQEYYLAQLGAKTAGVRVHVAMEHLGGSGDPGDKFTTPLATLHAHNGFADQFLVTPDDGLDDLFFGVSGKVGKVKGSAVYHIFESDSNNRDYGDEIDLVVSAPVYAGTTVGLKYAGFSGDDALFDDVQKVMGWISYTLL